MFQVAWSQAINMHHIEFTSKDTFIIGRVSDFVAEKLSIQKGEVELQSLVKRISESVQKGGTS